MTRRTYWILGILTILITGIFVFICFEDIAYVNANDDIESELYSVVLENLRATSSEDLNSLLNTVHSQSQGYQQTKQLAKHLFETYDLKHEIHLFRYVSQDGDYAIARLEFSTEQVAGPEFKDNRVDTFHIFRKENGQWKIWGQSVLTIEYI